MAESETVDVADGVGLVTDAAMLGGPVLVQIVEKSADGILLCDEDAHCVYVNPAMCRLLGRPVGDLVGYGYEQAIPPRDLVAAREYFAAVLGGSTELATQMLVDADGEEHEMVHASLRVVADGRLYGAALVRDFTDTRAARRSAAALAQSAAELVGDASTNEILSGIARHAVEATRALWAGIGVIGETDAFIYAAYGPDGADLKNSGEAYRSLRTVPASSILERMTAGAVRAGDVPGRAVTLTRSRWEQDPYLSAYGRAVLQHDWQFAVCIPLAYDNRVTGALMVLLPTGTTALDDADVAFCTALADHAAVAVANEHLSRQAERNAELRERGRVARELHDSVSQALFAMTMHARSAQLALARTGLANDTPLAESLEQLSQLSRGTLAEMRALIFELRPETLADEGLLRALKTQAAAISAREHMTITVDGPTGRLPIGAEIEADVYRMVSEILRDTIRRSSAESVAVTLSVEDHQLRTTIVYDAGVVGSPMDGGWSSLTDMAVRATAFEAKLDVSDGDQHTVSIVVPVQDPLSQVAAELL